MQAGICMCIQQKQVSCHERCHGFSFYFNPCPAEPNSSFIENTVDPDQLASDKAIKSGSRPPVVSIALYTKIQTFDATLKFYPPFSSPERKAHG